MFKISTLVNDYVHPAPASGYIVSYVWFIILFMFISENNMNTSTYFVSTISLIYAMKLIIAFGIKIYQKLPRTVSFYVRI